MKNFAGKFGNESGFSYVELLVIIGVISIVAAMAIMGFGTSREQFKRQNVAQQLKQAFERARLDSVKRRASVFGDRAYVTINASSYTLVTDNNSDGDVSDPEDAITTTFTGGDIVPGPSSSITIPATITFDQRGEITVSPNQNPVFLVCNGTCSSSTSTPDNSNIVLVTPTGTVNLLAGGSSVLPFSAPTNSALSGGATNSIKPDVVLP